MWYVLSHINSIQFIINYYKLQFYILIYSDIIVSLFLIFV